MEIVTLALSSVQHISARRSCLDDPSVRCSSSWLDTRH